MQQFDFNSPDVRKFADGDEKYLRENDEQQTVIKNPDKINFHLNLNEVSSGSDLDSEGHIQQLNSGNRGSSSNQKNNRSMKKRHTEILNSSIAGPQLLVDQPTPQKDNFLHQVEVEINDNIISGQGRKKEYNIQAIKQVPMDGIVDNTLKQLKSINDSKELTGIERCNEMIETLQYIQDNK